MSAAARAEPGIGGSGAGAGLLYALGAYVLWGGLPIFWKQLARVPADELLAYRVASSFAFCALLLSLSRAWPAFLGALRERRARRAMLASTSLIAVNWYLFIWAVNAGRILEASLGYYINPLLSVLVGRFVLGEKLGRLRAAAVLLAGVGVLGLALSARAAPFISLTLATTFCLYGLVRKLAPVAPLVGLAVETALVAPLALAYLAWLASAGTLTSGLSTMEICLLAGSGALTAIPLVWFAAGARRLRLSTLGIVQYVAPTLQFLVAVLLYGERFTRAHAFTFTCIWLAVTLYGIEASRSRPPAPASPR